MEQRIRALLVHDRLEPMGYFKHLLECQCAGIQSVKTCQEARQSVWGDDPPHLVLTDTRLPDGSWEDVVAMAAEAPAPVNVIVVSELDDVRLYLEAMQRGAFDFISPPASFPNFDHVARSAALDAMGRRKSLAKIARQNHAVGVSG